MSKRKQIHVTKAPKGWKVIEAGAKSPSSVEDTKRQAVKTAVEQAKKALLGQVVVHDKKGKIQTEWTYGKDKCPPKG